MDFVRIGNSGLVVIENRIGNYSKPKLDTNPKIDHETTKNQFCA